MKNSTPPDWLGDIDRWYYSEIEWNPARTVTVRSAPADADVSQESPGQLVLSLQPGRWTTRVFDAEGREQGTIRPEGILPGVRFVMRRDGAVSWVATVRSVVR